MSSRRRVGALVFALTTALVVTLTAGPAYAKEPDPSDKDNFEVYEGTVTPKQLDELRKVGVDAQDVTQEADGTATKVETVLTERQAARLAAKGVKLDVKRIRGKAASQVLREQAAAGWTAYRSYSEPGGIRDEIAAVAARYPRLTKVVTIGRTVQGKPIRAVKVTRNATQVADGSRPATAYMSAQHAREWITVEMTRRLLHHVLDNYGSDPAITRLVNRTELWFIPVANPDGYDYTFTAGNRLWRKNLRDNNGDGQITAVDGVDLNRNFAYKWGWDNEGSSPDPSSETYRGHGTELRTGDQGAGLRWLGGSASSSSSTTTRPRSCCSTASAGRSAPPRPTTRSTRRWSATTPTPRCRATTQTSPQSSTPPTATPTPT